MNYHERQQERFKAIQKCLFRMGAGGALKSCSMEIMAIITEALMEKPRNCDVATEAEAIESLRRTMPTEGLSEDERNIVISCIKDIVGALYAPYKTEGAE